jgi:serine protease Do
MPDSSLMAWLRTGASAGTMAFVIAVAGPSLAQQAPNDFASIVRQKAPAVVAITTKQMVEEQQPSISDDVPLGDFFRRQPRQQPRQALGSGFVISPDGYIITNNHVVESASEIHVVFSDKSNVPAKLVGRDPATDIAVLKVDPRPGMSVTSWGNSDALEPGAWTIAIGSPFGLGGTVTVGVLSARSRDIQAGPYDDFLQTDASINQGNSGGPLFNAQGEVIGVNTAIFSPSGGNIGIGFAVPSQVAQATSQQLIQTGRIDRGYLGIRLQDLTDSIAQAMGLPSSKGALVASVEPGSPAEKAGISSGDAIIRFNGQPVESARDLTRSVAGLKPGTSATLSVVRNGNPQELTVTVGQRTRDQAGQQSSQSSQDTGRRMGVSLSPLTEAARRELKLDSNASGVVVQQVDPNGPASASGIKPGDIIVAANNREVTQPSEVADEWAKARQQNKPVLLRIRRDGQYRFVAVGGA